MKRVKRLKLRKWVKVVIILTILIVLILNVSARSKQTDKIAKQCDKEKGYICSYYEVKQYQSHR